MNPLKRNILLFGFFLAIPVGWAGASTLEGTVTDADGKSLKDAEIRIEGKEGASGAKSLKQMRKDTTFTEDQATALTMSSWSLTAW